MIYSNDRIFITVLRNLGQDYILKSNTMHNIILIPRVIKLIIKINDLLNYYD